MNLPSLRRALGLGVALITVGLFGLNCSSLPTFVPDLAHRPARPVRLAGASGPLSAAQAAPAATRLLPTLARDGNAVGARHRQFA